MGVAKGGKCVDKPALAQTCPEGQVAGKDGKCAAAFPDCKEGETLKNGKCSAAFGDCKEGETLVDGKCKAATLAQTCPEGQVKGKDGKCAAAFPDCKEGEVLKEGKCAPAFAHECKEGETLVNGKCKAASLAQTCPEGQVKVRMASVP